MDCSIRFLDVRVYQFRHVPGTLPTYQNICYYAIYARLAQLVEHSTDTRKVLGSIPRARTRGMWRNWYTRTSQKRMSQDLGVRVSPCPLFTMTIVEQHHARVRSVQEQMKSFYARKQKVKIYHGTTNSTRAQTFEKGACIDVSTLDHVVNINIEEQYVLAEPNVPMDQLVEETLRHGLIPPVVPEFPGITVGGAVQGGAEESSSFKYGLVHDCCLEYEMILGNGEKIIASPEINPDLFWGTAASYGSLGIITLIKLRLIPAKNFVQLTYHTVKSFQEA